MDSLPAELLRRINGHLEYKDSLEFYLAQKKIKDSLACVNSPESLKKDIEIYNAIKNPLIRGNKKNNFLSCYFACKGDFKKFYSFLTNEALLHIYSVPRDNSSYIYSVKNDRKILYNIEECIRFACFSYIEFARDYYNSNPREIFCINTTMVKKFIMNNDLGYIPEKIDNYSYRVDCIWYPEVPTEYTLFLLCNSHPHYKYKIARTCIKAGYTQLYFTLDILPEITLFAEAVYYRRDLIINSLIDKDIIYEVIMDSTGSAWESPIPKIYYKCGCLKYTEKLQRHSSIIDMEDIVISSTERIKEDRKFLEDYKLSESFSSFDCLKDFIGLGWDGWTDSPRYKFPYVSLKNIEGKLELMKETTKQKCFVV